MYLPPEHKEYGNITQVLYKVYSIYCYFLSFADDCMCICSSISCLGRVLLSKPLVLFERPEITTEKQVISRKTGMLDHEQEGGGI
jgi:hypothetical protein